jgi:anti-sigma B factor antagonist
MLSPTQTFALRLGPPRDDGVPVVVVRGELDMYTSPEFEERLLALVDDHPEGLVVDLLGSTFVDSTAARALLRAAQRLAEHGTRLSVIYRDPEVARILTVMGLDEFLDVLDAGPSRAA